MNIFLSLEVENVERIISITTIGFLTGILGTGMGGLSAYIFKNPSNRWSSMILGFSGGLMISVVCFDLLPEAFAMVGLFIGILGIILGVMVISLIDEMISRIEWKYKKNRNGFVRTGILIGIGILIHNFPEGLAVGSGYMATSELGLGLALIIAIHDIPEGISMATPLSIGGIKSWKILLYTIIAGIPTGIGAFIGAVLGEISTLFIGLCLGFAGGAMLFITCQEIIPKSREIYKGRISGFGIIFGIIIGILASSLV
ncbi:ZIP family zinc transporter [Garciella nitratireducens]|nr:ZIP family metal transporter [Garciella nitratireducens]RBP37796.1 ZIP family zinc transporter [Garciella nitratireducens]